MMARLMGQTKTFLRRYSPSHDSAGASRHRRAIPRRLVPYALLLPAILCIVLLNLLTSAYGVYLSFLDWNYFRVEERFTLVGLKHYYDLFADPVFWPSVQRTFIWCAVVVPGAFLVGLYFALLLNEDVWAKSFFRTIILMPWAVPMVVVGILWYFMFASGIGIVSDLMSHLGMPQLKYMNWLGSQRFALPIVMGVQIWRWAPFFAVTLLAGLQAIPSTLYDAAKIDGAGTWGRFWHVTEPLLRPVTGVVFLQTFMWSFRSYALVFIMTEGGPANASELLTIYLWRAAFPMGQLGKAAAVGTLIVAFLSIVGTVWIIKVLGRGVSE